MIRDSEAARGRPRVGCNTLVKHVRRVFQWAESQAFLPRGTFESLKVAEDCGAATAGPPAAPKPLEPVVGAAPGAS
jgi:hypothetical protein